MLTIALDALGRDNNRLYFEEDGLAAVVDQAGGDVEQPVAQRGKVGSAESVAAVERP